eukprot:scaffold38017_cov72-Cyclotella_meneghiniana.AAC.11
MEVAAEIFNVDAPTAPVSIEEARSQLHSLIELNNGCSTLSDEADGITYSYEIFCALLCQALSPTCPNRTTYIERIMSMNDQVQGELMRIIQDNSEEEPTADYSALSSVMEGEESDDELPDSTEILNRSLLEEVASIVPHPEMSTEKEEDQSVTSVDINMNHVSDEEVKQLKATITKLQSELNTTRQTEQSLMLQVDEMSSTHKAEMIRVESQAMQSTRALEEKYNAEISELKRKHDVLQDADTKASELKEEVTRLRDELDVLNFSKEKLSYTEEQLRKLKAKLEDIGDAKSALDREEKAHSASVEKIIVLENELAGLKPLKRQLEEYKVRATDAEVALTECREDLRRLRERSCGLEGVNEELKRGVDAHMADVGSLQRRLKEGELLDDGGGVGVGMR